MKNNFKVYDNFLSNSEFEEIRNAMFNYNFPWFYQHMVAGPNHPDAGDVPADKNDADCFYFTHLFYNNAVSMSNFFNITKPIISKLNFKALKRVKGNLYTRTENLIYHTPHTDYNFPNKGAIYYLNTNNGLTIIDNKHKIQSVENRLLIFNANIPHNSTNCTDEKVRINININYF